jgi:hypothetical protein
MKLPIGSYSFYNTLQNCPHQAFHRYVAKTLPYVESPEMKWGNEVHAALEARIRRDAPLPEEMKDAEPIGAQFAEMRKHVAVRCELELAMTVGGQPCEYKDYDHVWFRGKLDCVTKIGDMAWMVDWKTGNVREDPFELECGALLLKVNRPELADIKGEYFWLKTGQAGLRYTLNDHARTFGKLVNLRNEAETYFKSGEWPKRKTPLCGWCDVIGCENNTKAKRLAKEGK